MFSGLGRDAKSECYRRRTTLRPFRMRAYPPKFILGACKRTRSANKRFPMRWPPKEIASAPSGFNRDAESESCRRRTALGPSKMRTYAPRYLRRMQPPTQRWSRAWWVHKGLIKKVKKKFKKQN